MSHVLILILNELTRKNYTMEASLSQQKKHAVPGWTFHVFQTGYHLAAHTAAAAGKTRKGNSCNGKRNETLKRLVSILEEDGLLPSEEAPMFVPLQASAA